VLLDEMMFAGNELLERAIAETRIFNEFISKQDGVVLKGDVFRPISGEPCAVLLTYPLCQDRQPA
jgi:hypothetical protein